MLSNFMQHHQMESLQALLILCLPVLLLPIALLLSQSWRHPTAGRRPPGPRPLPIIGNILELGNHPNQSLARLAKSHGPLMALRLGRVDTVVVSSAEVARLFHDKHDSVFCYRSTPDGMRATDHAAHSMAYVPPGPQWRHLRKVSNNLLFSPQRLDAYESLRCEKVQQLLKYVADCSSGGSPVDVGRVALTTTINLLSRTAFSTDLIDLYTHSSQHFKDVIEEIMASTGRPNISDFYPALARLDLFGMRRRATRLLEKLHKIFDEQIDRRVDMKKKKEDESVSHDLLDAVLHCKLQEDSSKSERHTMKVLFTDIFVAGSETSSSTVEWAMAELIRHPQAMAKAREELARVVGPAREMLESDICNLPYLRAVIKETMRLHPPAPFLIPRKAGATVEINGYTILAGTRVLVNTWAIGRDSEAWPVPEEFRPERFLGNDVDFRGKHFELIPFGAGRRICPGMPLAYRMMHLVLASLLHRFEWKLPEGMEAKDVDMTEKFGFTLCMAFPLKVMAIHAN